MTMSEAAPGARPGRRPDGRHRRRPSCRSSTSTRYYGSIHALRGISLEVGQGEIVALIGGNGAGKSTTLNSISGLVRPQSGQIKLDGEDLAKYPAHEIMAKGVVQVPEGRRIFARLTVTENLKMGAFIVKDKALIADRIERAFALFPRLKQREHPGRRHAERRRAADARDEPRVDVGPQDPPARRTLDGPRPEPRRPDLRHDQGSARPGHDDPARRAERQEGPRDRDRGDVIETGQIVLAGRGEDLRDNESVQKAYLGID